MLPSSPARIFVASLLVVLGLAMLIAVGCGPAAPAQVPAVAQPAPAIDQEALRSLVQDAVKSASAETAGTEEIKGMVAEAVASGTSPGVPRKSWRLRFPGLSPRPWQSRGRTVSSSPTSPVAP